MHRWPTCWKSLDSIGGNLRETNKELQGFFGHATETATTHYDMSMTSRSKQLPAGLAKQIRYPGIPKSIG